MTKSPFHKRHICIILLTINHTASGHNIMDHILYVPNLIYYKTSEAKTCSRGQCTTFIFATWVISAQHFFSKIVSVLLG